MEKEVPCEYNPYPNPTHDFSSKNSELMPTVVCRDIFNGLKEPEESKDLSDLLKEMSSRYTEIFALFY